MKINNIEDVDAFLKAVNECESAVWLESKDGNKINLKSRLSQYVAIAALISCEGNDLELFCNSSNDTIRLVNLLSEHKNIEA